MEAGTSPLQIQVAESIAVFFTDPGDQSVLEGIYVSDWWYCISGAYIDLQITKLSYNAAIIERSGVAGKLTQVIF